MNKDELLKIKEYALERHIPIIMDDTLEVIDKYLTEKRQKKYLKLVQLLDILQCVFLNI